jgi:phenylalanyl-tRNA synthetase beta chain
MVAEDSILRNQLKISNPLGDDTSVMRTTMLPSMLKIAARNYSRGVGEAKVFEVAYVYLPSGVEGELPEERRTLAGFAYGIKDGAALFYDTKASIEELFKVLGIRSYGFEPLTDDPTFHPGRTANIIVNGKVCGKLGIIHPDVAAGFETPSETCAFEIYVPQLVAASKKDRVYKQLPKFPGISRDLAVTTESQVTVADIIKTAKSAGGKYLRDVKMFDVYTGDKLGEGLKSVAISLSFRADDKTLSDDDIKKDIDSIISKLESKLGAKLRQ